MDIDSDYTVDLLNSIEFLSIENSELELELKKLEDDIKALEKEKLKYKSSGIKVTLNEDLPNIPSLNLKEYVKINPNENLKEVCITFTPFDVFKNVFICADFTNWEKRQMNNIGSNMFTASFNLLKGFRYFYHFYADGLRICDFNKESINNEYKNKELNNFVIVDTNMIIFNNDVNINSSESENDNSIVDFSKNLEFNYSFLLKTIKQGEIITPLIPENELLDKMLDYSVHYNMRESIISNKKDETLSKISGFYDNKIRYINDFFKDKNEEVLSIFKNRIIKINENMFLIQDLLFKEAAFMALKLYDINGIKIQNNSKFGMKPLERVLFKNVYENGNILSLEDSGVVIQEHENSNEKLKIFYQAMQITNFSSNNNDDGGYYSDEDENMDNLGYTKSSQNPNEFEIIPYKIEPDGVDINDYNLIIEGNKILSVKTRDTGHLVEFEAILINTKDRKLSGFVSTSKLKLFTNLYSKDIVNVIHIHLNDTSNEIAVDSVFLEKDQFPEDFKDFKTDITGKKLNYKFIFKDLKLNKIYYNLADNYIDEPGFEEVRISVGSMVKIISDKTFRNFYGLVKHVPIGMLVRKDKEKEDILQKMHSEALLKEGSCFERHLNELPGFVEIELQYDNEKNTLESDDIRDNLVNTLTKKNSNNFICVNKKIKISIPVCHLVNVSIKEQGEFERLKVQNQMKINETLKIELQQNFKIIKSYEKYINDQTLMLKELEDIQNTKEVLEIIDKIKLDYKINLEYEDENDISNMIEYINENKSKILSLLQQQLRILSLRGKK